METVCQLNQHVMQNPAAAQKESMHYWCSHYQQRCCIRAPCCNEIFGCPRQRIISMLIKSIDMIFHAIESNRSYVLFVTLKKRFSNFVLTVVCVWEVTSVRLASCLTMTRPRNNIIAMIVEGAMHHDCPVCFEYLFESRNDVTVMSCGHTIHKICLKEMHEYYQYACPSCSKSVCDMSKVFEKFNMEIAATPMR
ncbi:hypothetical protein ACSBR1_006492 [Camellia fascicularis]